VIRPCLLGAACALLLAAPAESSLRILSPAPGASVPAGELVTLRLALDAGESAAQVGVFSEGEAVAATAEGGEWVGQVRIPRDAVGPDLLVAYAVLNGGGVAMADVAVNVDAGPLRSLFISLPMRFTFAGETSGVEVQGVFEDGVMRDLAASELGTTYSSSDASVLAVDPAGIVQAVTTGNATLTVSSRGRTATATIEVRIPASDTNRIPTITPGVEQEVGSQQIVKLSATAIDPDGDTIEYLWEQVAGRVVLLHDPRSAQPEFASPRTSVPQVLDFMVAARDSKGATTLPVLVRVRVNPALPVGDE
jgi:hypothetical protein